MASLAAVEPRGLFPLTTEAQRPQSQTGDALIDVSVCIANWNCRELLHRCLASLHHCPQGVSVETIVVDNASSDGAAEMVAREFPEVRLIRNKLNVGFARANNQAAREAPEADICSFSTTTRWSLRTRSGRLLKYLEAHPDVSLVGPLLRDGRGKVQTSYRQRPTLAAWLHRTRLLRWTGLFRRSHRQYRRQRFEVREAQSVDVLLGAAMFMRRSCFGAMGGWDEDFHFGGEDLEFCLRAGARARSCICRKWRLRTWAG